MSAEVLIGEELAAAAVGISIGQVALSRVVSKVGRIRKPVFNSHPQGAVPNQRPKLRERILSLHNVLPALATLALFNGAAPADATVFPNSGPVQATVNQDFGYQLAKAANGNYVLSTKDSAAKLEDQLGDQLFGKVANLRMTAVDSNQAQNVNSPKELNSVPPYGNGAYLQTEVSSLIATGFTSAPKETNNLLTKKGNESVSGAVVVIDDGAPIGNITSSSVPIYIANVNSTNSTPMVTSSLKNVAKETGGHYWDVNTANFNSVADQIAADVHVSGINDNENGRGNIALLGLGATLLAAEYVYMRENISGLPIK